MIRIAVTGPESTGKSQLTRELAEHFSTVWVSEFAREYLEKTQGYYTYEDILHIARGQKKKEEEMEAMARGLLFCDTEFTVTRIWCEVKYGEVHRWILEQARSHRYNLYLLCDVDLPWEPDPLREHPELRRELFTRYHELMLQEGYNFRVISGTGEQRLRNAIEYIEKFLSNLKDPANHYL